MKNARLDTIRSLISASNVRNQEELQNLLKAEGINVTQATLSRDLRELGIVKAHDLTSGYCYKLPYESVLPSVETNPTFTVESIKSIEFSAQNAVIKTYPGFAGAVASIIDDNVREGIMGTLAGDDTVLLILRQPCDTRRLLANIAKYIKDIDEKRI